MESIQVTIRASQRLRILVGVMHALALLALLTLDPTRLPLYAKLVAIVAVILSAIWYDMRLHHPNVTAIEADTKGYRLLWRENWHNAELCEALITVPLTAIHFQIGPQRVDIPLLQDSTDADSYRQLRVWLRWSRMEHKSKQKSFDA